MSRSSETTSRNLFPEEIDAEWSEDSGDEGLGKMRGGAQRNKRFSVVVNYEDSAPQLNIIPSSWRYETKLGSTQGDHVVSYCIILESAANCEGRNIKQIPDLFYDFVSRVIPESSHIFEDLRDKIKNDLERDRAVRKNATANLRAGEAKYEAAKNLMKKNEIELIARHLEEVADRFVEELNSVEDAVFSKFRKEAMPEGINKEATLQALELESKKDATHKEFFEVLRKGVEDNADAKTIAPKLAEVATPPVITRNKGDKKVRPKSLGTFIEYLAPQEKYHEGMAATNLREKAKGITAANQPNEEELGILAKSCAGLFDYRYTKKTQADYLKQITDTKDLKNSSSKKLRVEEGETDEAAAKRHFEENRDDEEIFYRSSARLIILIFSAFRGLNELSTENKKKLYEGFLEKILLDQLWNLYEITTDGGQTAHLDKDILAKKIEDFAVIDFENNNLRMRQKYILESSGSSADERIAYATDQWKKDVDDDVEISIPDYRSLLKLFSATNYVFSAAEKQKISDIVFEDISRKDSTPDGDNLFSTLVEKGLVDCEMNKDGNSILIWAAGRGYRKTFNAMLYRCSDETLNLSGSSDDTALMWALNCDLHDEAREIIARSTKESLEKIYSKENKSVTDFIDQSHFSEEEKKDLKKAIEAKKFMSVTNLTAALDEQPSPSASAISSAKVSSRSSSRSRSSSESSDG